MVAASVVQLAQRRGIRSVGVMIADYAWGQSFKSSLEDESKKTPNIRFNVQVAPVPTTNFTPYLRAFGDVSLIVATGHPPGAPLILAQSGALGLKAPVIGADGPWSLTAKNASTSAFGRYSDFKCMATASKAYKTLAKKYLKTFPQNEFFEDDALAGYAYVKIVAEAIRNVGPNSQAIATYVHGHTFNIPGYGWPLKWTAWGEMIGARPQYAILTKSAPPEAGLNTASTTFWPRVIFRSPALTPYRP
jgi:branched-chain amino acid transport system substrate-binding protein